MRQRQKGQIEKQGSKLRGARGRARNERAALPPRTGDVRRGSNPCECNVFILQLELNVNCASAANLHSRCTRMKQISSPPCARGCGPCENEWCTIGRINLDTKKKHRERLGSQPVIR